MENGWGGEGMGMRFGWRSGGGGDEREREQRAMPGTGRAGQGLQGKGRGCPGWIFGTGPGRVCWGCSAGAAGRAGVGLGAGKANKAAGKGGAGRARSGHSPQRCAALRPGGDKSGGAAAGRALGPAVMQLSGAALLLCAAAAGMAAGPAPGTGRAGTERRTAAAGGKERRAQFASWDEVNVIAHGLLQLGHGLKEHVDRTKGQMRELGSRLSAHNSSMGRLLRQARETQEQGELLRASVRELEGRGRQLFNLSEALRQRLEEVAADKAEIQGRLEQLEGRVRQALQARPAENQSSKDLGALQVGAERRCGGLRGDPTRWA